MIYALLLKLMFTILKLGIERVQACTR